MSNKIYFVEFETQEHCTIYYRIFHCIAANAKEARAKAEEAWYSNGEKRHMFHIYAKKSRTSKPEYLGVRNYTGKLISGTDVLNHFILYNLKPWRISGRNLYP